jgi:endonuclease YncB( thermonuclease family)
MRDPESRPPRLPTRHVLGVFAFGLFVGALAVVGTILWIPEERQPDAPSGGVPTPAVADRLGEPLSAAGYLATVRRIAFENAGITIDFSVANAGTAPLDHDPRWLTVVDEATGERYGADETGTFQVGTVIPGGRAAGTIHVPLPSTAHQIRVIYATPYGDLVWTDRRPNPAADRHVSPSNDPRIIDGETFEVPIDDVSHRVRIYGADTPETQTEQQCGGPEATAFAEWVLSLNENPVIYLEKDTNARVQYGRELAYVWFEIDSTPYLLNHILINNGWAEDVDYGDRTYGAKLQAAAFAQRHDLGVWELAGGIGDPVPAPVQPTQPPAPVPSDSDPNDTGCIPIVSYDLDCADIGVSVQVIVVDTHGFDGNDNDGWGCESYQSRNETPRWWPG